MAVQMPISFKNAQLRDEVQEWLKKMPETDSLAAKIQKTFAEIVQHSLLEKKIFWARMIEDNSSIFLKNKSDDRKRVSKVCFLCIQNDCAEPAEEIDWQDYFFFISFLTLFIKETIKLEQTKDPV